MSTENWIREIGEPAVASIAEMVAALNLDWDRLEELRDERDMADSPEEWAAENPEDAEELSDLEATAGECEDREDAERRIHEDALSVEVRSGWTVPGEPMEAEEFAILLTTGGPAVRIRGELDQYGEPDRAWLEVQDWGKPWAQYFGDSDMLLSYTCCFSFGGGES